MSTGQKKDLLKVEGLSVSYDDRRVLDDVSLSMSEGQSVALVGESGSGKTTLLKTIAGLLPPSARIDSGKVEIKGHDVLKLRKKHDRDLRRQDVGFLFQNAQNSFDPLFTIGHQFDEALKAVGLEADTDNEVALLRLMGVENPAQVLNSLPSELSGGLCQRASLAIALSCPRAILLADEPTSGLDVENQKKVGKLLQNIGDEMCLLLVTHDIKFAAEVVDEIAVMLDGVIVERGKSSEIIESPKDDYTKELVASIPKMVRHYKRIRL